VAAALLDDGHRVLACRRTEPPAYAGRWEFPGGKVEPGEDERGALIRECREELGIEVEVGPALGEAALDSPGWVLRVWFGRVAAGTPTAIEHDAMRWLAADELDEVPWLPADVDLVAELRRRLHAGTAWRPEPTTETT
jgi:8-oxo-dGTP diphosphatase